MLYNDSRLAWRGSAPWRRHFSALAGRFRPPGHCRPGRGRRRRKPGWSRISHRCRWRANSRIVPSRGPGGVPGTGCRWCRLPRVEVIRIECTIQLRPTPSAGARNGPSRSGVETLRPGRHKPVLLACRDGIWPWPSPVLSIHTTSRVSGPAPVLPCHTDGRADVPPGLPRPCDTFPDRPPDGWQSHAGAVPRPSAARFAPSPFSCSVQHTVRSSCVRARGSAFHISNIGRLPCGPGFSGDNARGPPPGVYPGPWWAQRR